MSNPINHLKQYPEHTEGCKLASEARKAGNSLSNEKRAELFKLGMALIYGGGGKQTFRTRH
jgi:hypothetical protein